MSAKFSAQDLQQIASLGLTEADVQHQIDNFRQGFPKTELVEAATVDNGGILRLSDEEINRYASIYATASQGKKILKFVPASGAATRMFKDLYSFAATYFGIDYKIEKEHPSVKEFLENIRTFAFFDDLVGCMAKHQADFGDYMDRGDFSTVINFLLKEQYMGYGNLPKGLLKFHKYGHLQRTPLEEHIVEGAEYARMSDDTVNLHFTVSPEHRPLFRKKVAEVKRYYEDAFHVKLNISFSEQKHYTDIIAVDEQNNPVRDEEGRLIFRPGGHGALIENLNEQRADLIFVKNIDNVVPDWMKHSTIIYKKVLAGLLLNLQQQCFDHLHTLDHGATPSQLEAIEQFVQHQLHLELPEGYPQLGPDEKAQRLHDLLNRPMRICGMVRNQGEPGGGPFFTRMESRASRLWRLPRLTAKTPTKKPFLPVPPTSTPSTLCAPPRTTKDAISTFANMSTPPQASSARRAKEPPCSNRRSSPASGMEPWQTGLLSSSKFHWPPSIPSKQSTTCSAKSISKLKHNIFHPFTVPHTLRDGFFLLAPNCPASALPYPCHATRKGLAVRQQIASVALPPLLLGQFSNICSSFLPFSLDK